MSYARNLLSRGEEVVFESRQHWFAVIARTWLWIVVAILGVAVLVWSATSVAGTGGDVLTIGSAVALIVSAVMVAIVLLDWQNQEWLVTTRRVIRAEGILNKNMADSSLEKVNDARLSQSWIGRIFNYGTLDILTAAEEVGGEALADFPMLADPVDFKVAMLNQKEILERPDLAPPRYQRPAAPPEMRPEAQPPRAGSSRVAEVRREQGRDDGVPVDVGEAGLPVPPDDRDHDDHERADRGRANDDQDAPWPVPDREPVAAQAPAPPRSAADELADTLERLAGLRDRGLITDEEYDAKKRDILERM